MTVDNRGRFPGVEYDKAGSGLEFQLLSLSVSQFPYVLDLSCFATVDAQTGSGNREIGRPPAQTALATGVGVRHQKPGGVGVFRPNLSHSMFHVKQSPPMSTIQRPTR